MLGISTCWWHKQVDRGDEIVRGILELGLKGVELEYRITETMYRQMKPMLKKDVKVLTIHNYFPKPEEFANIKGSGDLFLLSSADRDERLRAVNYAIRTLEHAHDLEAKVVILHLGRVEMPNPIFEIKELLGKGKTERNERLSFINEQRKIREARHQRHLDAVLSSLDVLNREAEKKDVFLGIENRYHFHEIPNFEEMEVILKQFQGGHIVYWHDVGHAAVQEKIGFIGQKDLLEAFSEMLAGIHLHDAKGLDDHFAPGQGEVSFEQIRLFLEPSHIKILEVHPKVGKKDLLNAIQYLKSFDTV